MSLSLASTIEKNRLSTTGANLILLEIQLSTPIYIVNNNENITWNGQLWLAFPFRFGELTYDQKELPNISIEVSNITRVVGAAIETAGGGGGTQVILRVVNSKLLSEPALIEEYFTVKNVSVNAQWVTITIGVNDEGQKRVHDKTVMKNFCSYLTSTGFKGIECGYNGVETTCNGTLTRCRELNNSARYGGEPGLE